MTDAIESRRDALKRGAITAGIGAAAFSTPTIVSHGLAPRFASAQSGCPPIEVVLTGAEITSVNNARDINGCRPNINTTGEILMALSDAGLAVLPDNTCITSGYSGVITTDPDQTCRVTITVYERNDVASTVLATQTLLAPGMFSLPPVADSSPNNFWGFSVECLPAEIPDGCPGF